MPISEYHGNCEECGNEIQEGEEYIYNEDERIIYCLKCGKFARAEYWYFKGLGIVEILLVILFLLMIFK